MRINWVALAVVVIVVALAALAIVMEYGLNGLLSFAFLGLLAVVSGLLNTAGSRNRHRTVPFNPPGAGPTDQEIDLDPMFKMFPHNIHHNSN